MNIDMLRPMVVKQWRTEGCPMSPPPEAKVITGNPSNDARLHFLKTTYGFELIISRLNGAILDYNVVDAEKFTWFVLKWS